MKKKILLVVVLAAAVALGVGLATAIDLPRLVGGERAPGPLTLYGNVEVRDARLAFTESGMLAAVEVDEGDVVDAGRVVARLRTERLDAQRASASATRDARAQALLRLENGTRPEVEAQARVQVSAAGVRVDNAERALDRVQKTSGSGASSRADLDDATADRDVAAADLEVARESLRLAEIGPRAEDVAEGRAGLAAAEADLAFLDRRVEDLVLRAPAAGIVQSRVLEPGEQAGPGAPVLTLALTTRKWVRAWVPEPSLGRVTEGQGATLLSDTWPGQRFGGRVGFVSPTAEFTPRNVETEDLRTRLVYEVRVWVDDPEGKLRLGMPVTVELSGDRGPRPEPAGAEGGPR